MNNVLLEAQSIAKRYGNKTVLQGVDLTIKRGEAIALVGHNGSGKSTLLKMLAGLVRPSQGTITGPSGARFAYVPEHFPKMNLTAAQYIRHMGLIEGLDKQTLARRGEALFAAFSLSGMEDIPIKHLSKGSIQKVGVVQALLTDRDVILLDEPLSGQDTHSQQVFVQKILERKKAGATVLLSCHETHLVRRLADTVYEIREKTLHEASVESVTGQAFTVLTFTGGQEGRAYADLPPGCTVRAAQGTLTVTAPSHASDAVIIAMIQGGLSLKGISHEVGL